MNVIGVEVVGPAGDRDCCPSRRMRLMGKMRSGDSREKADGVTVATRMVVAQGCE